MENTVSIDFKTALEKNGAISFVPTGNSMWPILKDGGQSVLVEAKKGRLERFDVALYVADGKNVLHRVLKVTDDGYVTCGDSMNVLESVPEQAVFGKMVGFYKKDVFVSCDDKDYKKRVENWYKRKRLRKIRLWFFHQFMRVKRLIRKIVRKRK